MLACKFGSVARSTPGWMIESLTTRVAPVTAEEKNDQPLLKAPMGFSCNSENVGTARDERWKDGSPEPCGGGGVFPKP